MNSSKPQSATIANPYSAWTLITRPWVTPRVDAFPIGCWSVMTTLWLMLVALLSINPAEANAGESPLKVIVDAYANDLINGGHAVGVGVGVVKGGQVVGMFSYGEANVAKVTAFTADSIFEIGSVTKVFTTNLLGQKAATEGQGILQQQLETFQPQFPGVLNEKTGLISLLELGDFTAGLPDLPPLCSTSQKHRLIRSNGCLPNGRPSLSQYSARHFLNFLKSTTPRDYDKPDPPDVSLPAPYFYSDYTTGLLGLLIATRPNQPITNKSLDQWWSLVKKELVVPLGMTSTYLKVPKTKVNSVAQGYNLAQAGEVSVTNGAITSIALLAEGAGYQNQPKVQIAGGNGIGAVAVAELNGKTGGVKSISVTNPGVGYIAAPTVLIGGGGGHGATGRPIISGGSLVGVEMTDLGQCYTASGNDPITVVIDGGRLPNADPAGQAEAVAQVVNGQVRYIAVTKPGTDYVDPITVSLAPGGGITNKTPIWAAAGSIKSTVRDMTQLMLAALGETRVGGQDVNPAIIQGFKIAETPYTDNGNGSGSSCANNEQTGLAWLVTPASAAEGYPQIISKNGGLDGFSTQVVLVTSDNPEDRLGVVVFVNSRAGIKSNNLSFGPAAVLANNITGWLLHQKINP